ncbi:MAG: hypothetical protein FWE19_04395 [Oscillospiraceae bacterium]|nr:hypothetical protein [Oscillospiraceae bacterium]
MRRHRKLLIFLLTAILIIGAVPAALASSSDERWVTVEADRNISISFVFRGDRDDGRQEPSVRIVRITDHTLFRAHRDLVEVFDIIVDSGTGTRGATVSISRDRRMYVYNAQRRLVGTTDDVHEFSSRFFLSTNPLDGFGAAVSGQTTLTPPPPAATAAVIPANINPANAPGMVEQAVRSAAPNTIPSITLNNPGNVDLAFMQAAVTAAQGQRIAINADSFTSPSDGVDVRIRFDPALATTSLDLSGSTTSSRATATRNLFHQYFNRTVSVVSLGQQGNFGMEVRIAARVDLPAGFNLQDLHFYSFDRGSNTVQRFVPNSVSVDTNRYLHFATSVAGDIIIATGALAPR